MELTYSNPRKSATFADWPYSHTLRTTCTFRIQASHRGERVVRTTYNPKDGKPTAPKALTYSRKQVIVDGSDGKTYVVCLSVYGTISVMQSNMKFQQESIHEDDPRYVDILALFD